MIVPPVSEGDGLPNGSHISKKFIVDVSHRYLPIVLLIMRRRPLRARTGLAVSERKMRCSPRVHCKRRNEQSGFEARAAYVCSFQDCPDSTRCRHEEIDTLLYPYFACQNSQIRPLPVIGLISWNASSWGLSLGRLVRYQNRQAAYGLRRAPMASRSPSRVESGHQRDFCVQSLSPQMRNFPLQGCCARRNSRQ